MSVWTLAGVALWALIPGNIASKKGRNFWVYFGLSFILSPLIMTIVALCVSSKIPEDTAPSSGQEDSSDQPGGM